MGLEYGSLCIAQGEYGYGYKRARSRLFLRSEKPGGLSVPGVWLNGNRPASASCRFRHIFCLCLLFLDSYPHAQFYLAFIVYTAFVRRFPFF